MVINNILTPSGYVPITDINIGDQVIAYEVGTGNIIYNNVLKKEYLTSPCDPTDTDFSFYLVNNTWTLYKDQSIWRNRDVVGHIYELQVGDIVFDDQNNDVVITSIEPATASGWWRMEISNDRSYIADNVTLHNASRTVSSSGGWWGATSTWVENSLPTASDDVIANAASGQLTLASNGGGSIVVSIASLSFISGSSNYANIFTYSQSASTLTIGGSLTFSPAMTVNGSNRPITINRTAALTSAGKVIPYNLVLSAPASISPTMSIQDNWTMTGTLTLSTAQNVTMSINNPGIFNLSGSFSVQPSDGSFITGSSSVRLIGTGAWTGSTTFGTGLYGLNTTISSSGNITIGTPTNPYIMFGNGATLTYITGSVDAVTPGTILYIRRSAILDVGPITWANALIGRLAGTETITLNSPLIVSNNISLNSAITAVWTGSFGFTAGSLFILSSTAVSHQFQAGVTYSIRNAISCTSSLAATPTTIISSDTINNTRAIITLSPGATQDIGFLNATNIDSSQGVTIYSYKGILSNTLNWKQLTIPQTAGRINIL